MARFERLSIRERAKKALTIAYEIRYTVERGKQPTSKTMQKLVGEVAAAVKESIRGSVIHSHDDRGQWVVSLEYPPDNFALVLAKLAEFGWRPKRRITKHNAKLLADDLEYIVRILS
jgi:hypothetical protein